MNTKFGIKNFRIFDEDGILFDISPITILTGTNSAGKSSLAKACLLLESFLKQVSFDIEKCRLDFMSYPLNTLGRYDKAIHKGSKNTKITFSYSKYSNYIFDYVTVTLTFNRDDHDDLNNGLLETLLISVKNQTVYSWSRKGGYRTNYCNYYLLKDAFTEFIRYEYELQRWADLNKQKLQDAQEGDEGDYSEEEEHINNFLCSRNDVVFSSVLEHMSRGDGKNLYFGEKLKEEEIGRFCLNSTLFSFSLYEKIENMDADHIEEFFLDLVEKIKCRDQDRPKLIIAVKKIVASFKASGQTSFLNYIVSLETDYMHSDKFRDYHLEFWPFKLTSDTLMENHLRPSNKYVSFNGPKNPTAFVINKNMEQIDPDFIYAYELLSVLDCIYQPEPKEYIWEYDPDFGVIPVHKMYDVFKRYFTYFIQDCLQTDWNLMYVGSSRVEVKKMYSLESRDSFTRLLLDYFNCTKAIKSKPSRIIINMTEGENKYVINSFTNKWLEKFGVGKKLIFKVDENGLGVQIFIQKQEDEEPVLLAYEGYGITQLVSLILQIEVSILKAKNKYVNALCLDSLRKFYYEEQTIIIEEPEIHLHPKYQSLLADMFYEAYKEYGIHFIIETHSEYLIRKTQVLVARMGFTSNNECEDKNPFQAIYIASGKEAYSLEYRMDGKFKNDFGPGFFDEAVNLMMEIF